MSTKYSHRLSIKACFSPTGHYWWNTRDLLGVSMIFRLLTLEPIDRCYASVCVSAYRTEEKQLIKIIHRNLGFKKQLRYSSYFGIRCPACWTDLHNSLFHSCTIVSSLRKNHEIYATFVWDLCNICFPFFLSAHMPLCYVSKISWFWK